MPTAGQLCYEEKRSKQWWIAECFYMHLGGEHFSLDVILINRWAILIFNIKEALGCPTIFMLSFCFGIGKHYYAILHTSAYPDQYYHSVRSYY